MDASKIIFGDHAAKRVSFIIQTKNKAKYLDEILTLCRTLVKSTDELIVVDGASTDHTKEIVKKYQDLIDIFISEPDVDGNHAQNKALLLARGKFVKQLGDDDVFYPEAMEQAIAVLEAHPEIDVLLCGGTKEFNGKVRTVYLPPGVEYGKSVEDVFRYLGPASGTGHMWRRSALARIGLFTLDHINADAEFVLRAIKRGATVKFCRINLYAHKIYGHSVTSAHRRKHLFDSYCLIWEYCSLPFAISYIVRSEYYEHPVMFQIRTAVRRIFRGMRTMLRGDFSRSKKVKTYTWDGGIN